MPCSSGCHVRRCLVTLSLAVLLNSPAQGFSLDLYVSTNGNDHWSGRIPHPAADQADGPFETFVRARDEIRTLRLAGGYPIGGVTVWIASGLYPLSAGFVLDSEDSGELGSPVEYRRVGNGEVRVIGGIPVGDWHPITDAAVKVRLNESARGSVLQSDLSSLGIRDFGKISSGSTTEPAGIELFYRSRPMQLAQWPNEGWASTGPVPPGDSAAQFTYQGNEPEHWAQSDDIWVHGYWKWDWADSYEQVHRIDTARHLVFTNTPHSQYGYADSRRFVFLNVLEELDEPGEWYLDRVTGTIYFWPPGPIEPDSTFVSILSTPIIALHNVSHVRLVGIDMECGRGIGIEVLGGSDNQVRDCTVRNMGTVGVFVSGGSDQTVRGCHVSETGEGGIVVIGGDRRTLTPSKDQIIDNRITRSNRWLRTHRPAIRIDGVGISVSHNAISDLPDTAVMLNGNDNMVEYNDISAVCLDSSDVGAFYMGRDWTERGNIVRFNYFHDIGSARGKADNRDVIAVYLDDFTSGTIVYGNVFLRARAGVFIGGGRDNTVQNNLFIDCLTGVRADARGLSWAKGYIDGTVPTLFDRLKAVAFDAPPYSVRYPTLANILDDEPGLPKGNLITSNVSLGGTWLELRDGLTDAVIGISRNYVPQAAEAGSLINSDLELARGSPAFQLGFKPIPFREIGPRESLEQPGKE
jgi:hypothetical protein